MGASCLQPQPDFEPDAAGRFLTFIVPASDGCNLKIPKNAFCLVRRRQEIRDTHLRPDDFARFILEAAKAAPIFALAIQGYEPLPLHQLHRRFPIPNIESKTILEKQTSNRTQHQKTSLELSSFIPRCG
jgi:hypothetical protein